MKYIAYRDCKRIFEYGNLYFNKGFHCYANNGRLYTESGKSIGSVNAYKILKYFTQNEDGRGLERGELLIFITEIIKNNSDMISLIERDKVVCPKYLSDSDSRIWNPDFYNAPIEDLEYIKNLIIS